jgi:hypothetical protein
MAGYEKAILTHIDIMGFSDLIDESKAQPDKVSEIARTLQTIRTQFLEGGRRGRKFGQPSGRFVAINFSDLTVRVTYVDKEESLLDCLDWELFYLITKQYDLTVTGILIRGGISIGDIYVESDNSPASLHHGSAKIIFGPALVSAYKLESKIATFPRIAIDPALMVEVRKSSGKIPSTYFRRGDDGIYFVDYLRGECDKLGYTAADVDETLERHKIVAIDKLKQLNKRDDKIRQKALWLALYHNSTIEQMNGPSLVSTPPLDTSDLFATPSVPLKFDSHLITDIIIDASSS